MPRTAAVVLLALMQRRLTPRRSAASSAVRSRSGLLPLHSGSGGGAGAASVWRRAHRDAPRASSSPSNRGRSSSAPASHTSAATSECSVGHDPYHLHTAASYQAP